jgi:TetR/AcrR family transcriptional regulator, mexJK operon transcriptional repressor
MPPFQPREMKTVQIDKNAVKSIATRMAKKPPTQKKAPGAARQRLQADRIAEILDIAAEVFIADGYQAASTNKIARLANASKTTFYSRFPSKEKLFLAVIERRMAQIFDRVAQFPELPEMERTLRQFGTNVLRIALSAEQIALVRMISMEAGKYPELAQRFFEIGPGRGEQALASYLALQIKAGCLRTGDPLTMARQMLNLLTGSPVRWFVLGFSPEPIPDRAMAQHVENSVALFLRAYAP